MVRGIRFDEIGEIAIVPGKGTSIDDDATYGVAMATDPFGGRVDYYICTELKGAA